MKLKLCQLEGNGSKVSTGWRAPGVRGVGNSHPEIRSEERRRLRGSKNGRTALLGLKPKWLSINKGLPEKVGGRGNIAREARLRSMVAEHGQHVSHVRDIKAAGSGAKTFLGWFRFSEVRGLRFSAANPQVLTF